MEGTLGEIRLFAPNFAPENWAYCEGQQLQISQNQSLFSILGTTYGGDGRVTFGLPDLRGRAPVSSGTGPGLTTRKLGSKNGSETVTVEPSQAPPHGHNVQLTLKSISSQEFLIAKTSNKNTPVKNYFADGGLGKSFFGKDKNTGKSMDAEMLSTRADCEVVLESSGGGQPHNNMQPYLVLSYIICLKGVYPSRS